MTLRLTWQFLVVVDASHFMRAPIRSPHLTAQRWHNLIRTEWRENGTFVAHWRRDAQRSMSWSHSHLARRGMRRYLSTLDYLVAAERGPRTRSDQRGDRRKFEFVRRLCGGAERVSRPAPASFEALNF